MAKPPVLYHDWTFWVPVNLFVCCYLDIRTRLELLLRPQDLGHAAWWIINFHDRVRHRRNYREKAAEICKRHELMRFCSICDDEDEEWP